MKLQTVEITQENVERIVKMYDRQKGKLEWNPDNDYAVGLTTGIYFVLSTIGVFVDGINGHELSIVSNEEDEEDVEDN